MLGSMSMSGERSLFGVRGPAWLALILDLSLLRGRGRALRASVRLSKADICRLGSPAPRRPRRIAVSRGRCGVIVEHLRRAGHRMAAHVLDRVLAE